MPLLRQPATSPRRGYGPRNAGFVPSGTQPFGVRFPGLHPGLFSFSPMRGKARAVLGIKLLNILVEVFLQVLISVIAARRDEIEQLAGFGDVVWRGYFK